MIAYSEFVLKGSYKSAISSYINKSLLDNNTISFGYEVNGEKYERNQSVKTINKLSF